MSYPDWDEIEREVMRPVPRELTGPEIAVRARIMQTRNRRRATIQAAMQPGQQFTWPNEGGYRGPPDYAGLPAEFLYRQEDWVYIKFPNRTQNIGLKRFCRVLQMLGKVPQGTGV